MNLLKKVHSVTAVYTNHSILHSDVNWRNVWRLTQTRKLIRDQSLGLSPLMGAAVSSHQRTQNEIMDREGLENK